MKKRPPYIFIFFFVLFFGTFLAYPTWFIVKGAFFVDGHFSLAFFKAFLNNPTLTESLYRSFALASVTTLLTFLMALPLAYSVANYRFKGKSIFSSIILVPMIMPPFVGALGMRQLFAKFGSINLLLMKLGIMTTPIDWFGNAGFWGVVILEALHLYPIMYLNLSSALANIDPTMEEAARNVGSSSLRLFRSITLPLMMPGLFAGAIIVFIWSFTDLGTPLMFGYLKVSAVKIFEMVSEMGTNPTAYVLVVIVLAITAVCFLFSKLVVGRKSFAMISKGSVAATGRRVAKWKITLVYIFFVVILLAAMVPHLSVILTSIKAKWFMTVLPEEYTFQHYFEALNYQLTISSIKNSIFYSLSSSALDIFFGVWIAYVLVRKKVFGASVMDAIAMLPLALPGIVLAFGFVGCFSGISWLDPKNNPTPLLIIAYSVRRLPYVLRAAYTGFQQLSVVLEEASLNVGATPFKTLRKISIPLIASNLIAGGIIAFSFAMLEVSDSLILAFKEKFYPITKTIYVLGFRAGDGPAVASAMGVWAMLLLIVTLVTAGVIIGKKMGELFRA